MNFRNNDVFVRTWYSEMFAAEMADGRLSQAGLFSPRQKPGRRGRDGKPHYWHRWLIECVTPRPAWLRMLESREMKWGFELMHSPLDMTFAVPTLRAKDTEWAFVIPIIDWASRRMLEDILNEPLQVLLRAPDAPMSHPEKLDFRGALAGLSPGMRIPRKPAANLNRVQEFANALSQYLRANGRPRPEGVEVTYASLVLLPTTAHKFYLEGPGVELY